ncbi:hypothetical protein [Actinoallomurus sp. NPDC050550]|uniref:hypothetical protein n=1 Tax=Actinoallomurus sp. NPDC050550 TaxID=3154937 RepID=UPI0033DAF776
MRAKGINYGTGFFPGGQNSRKVFEPDVVRRDADHCRRSGTQRARRTTSSTNLSGRRSYEVSDPFL